MCDIQMCENIRNTINPEGVVKKIVGTSLLLLKERRQKKKRKKERSKTTNRFCHSCQENDDICHFCALQDVNPFGLAGTLGCSLANLSSE